MRNVCSNELISIYKSDVTETIGVDTYIESEKLFLELSKAGAERRRMINRIVELNLPIVINEANKVFHSFSKTHRIDLEDLIQEGNIGLIIAVKKFNPYIGVSFYTYAALWIKKAMTRYIYKNNTHVRLPENVSIELYKTEKAINELKEILKREPTDGEVADLTGFKSKRVTFIRKYIGVYNENNLDDLFDLCNEIDVIDIAIENENKAKLISLLNILPDNSKRVMYLRYGLHNGEELSFEEIGNRLSRSKQRAHQLHNEAMGTICNYVRKHKITL